MMMVGIRTPLHTRSCCNSNPVISGICKSRMRQSGSPSASDSRNSRADRYVFVLNARAPRSRASAFSTEGSSSTRAMQFEAFAIGETIHLGRTRVELALGPMGDLVACPGKSNRLSDIDVDL